MRNPIHARGYNPHLSLPSENHASYTSLLEEIIEGWKSVYPITQADVGINSQEFLARLKIDVDLYKKVLDHEDSNPEVIGEMEDILKKSFTRILSLLGNGFYKSPFGDLYKEYCMYKESNSPLGVGAMTEYPPCTATKPQLQPQTQS